MTSPADTRTLEQNLRFLRLIDDGHLAEMILRLPAHRREQAAAAVVRLEAPIRDTLLGASDDDRPATVQRILEEADVR